MAIIGLVADTHFGAHARGLPKPLEDGLRAARVELILHLGDLIEPASLRYFEAIAPVDAVAGNNDPYELLQVYGERKILRIDGMRVGMIHGHQGRRNAHENALRAFAYETVDAIFYGHSHAPRVERIPDGPLIANPGSPTQRRAQPRHSFAIATIGDGKIELTHHYFD